MCYDTSGVLFCRFSVQKISFKFAVSFDGSHSRDYEKKRRVQLRSPPSGGHLFSGISIFSSFYCEVGNACVFNSFWLGFFWVRVCSYMHVVMWLPLQFLNMPWCCYLPFGVKMWLMCYRKAHLECYCHWWWNLLALLMTVLKHMRRYCKALNRIIIKSVANTEGQVQLFSSWRFAEKS